MELHISFLGNSGSTLEKVGRENQSGDIKVHKQRI